MGFRDGPTGQIKGFEADLARALGKQVLGAEDRIEFVPVTDEQRIPSLIDGHVDMVLAQLTITPERAELVAFSIPYLSTREGLLVSADSEIKGFDDLINKRIVVTAGSVSQLRMQDSLASLPGATLITTPLTYGGLEAVAQGQADAASNDVINLTMLRLAATHPDAYRIIDLGDRFAAKPFGVAVRTNNRGRLERLNQAIQALQDGGEMNRLLNHNLSTLR